MSLTITVSDPLATKLQSLAAAERVSVDQLASRLLKSSVERPLEPETWSTVNQRRLALIEKRFAQGLSAEEQQELPQLQEIADRQLEELDEKMLSDLANMESAAREALGASE